MLVIDDDRAGATALVNLLSLAGADARAVHDAVGISAAGEAAWRADVVVTDWHIGGDVTGADAVAMLRKAWNDMPVLVMTGDGALATEPAIRATGWPLFWKPIDLAGLVAAIAKAAVRRDE